MDNGEILQRIEEIEHRTALAAPGPWKIGTPGPGEWWVLGPESSDPIEPAGTFSREEDVNFIAHSREDVPWLCQIVRKLLAVADAARELAADPSPMPSRPRDWSASWTQLKRALAALEGENDVDC